VDIVSGSWKSQEKLLILLDGNWSLVTETMEEKNKNKGGLLSTFMHTFCELCFVETF
jgi:hypothetical protein